MGEFRRLSTRDQRWESGSASSRANAHVVRDAATVMLMEQKRVIVNMSDVRATPPAGEPMTWLKI